MDDTVESEDAEDLDESGGSDGLDSLGMDDINQVRPLDQVRNI